MGKKKDEKQRKGSSPCALDAPGHDGLDKWAKVLVHDGSLHLSEATSVSPKSHGLVLQVTLSSLITDGAIEWVVHQQEFHDSFPCLFCHWCVRLYLHTCTHKFDHVKKE
jgi:hypothetical protein